MAEAAARRRELRRQRILNQNKDRLAVVMGEKPAEVVSELARAGSSSSLNKSDPIDDILDDTPLGLDEDGEPLGPEQIALSPQKPPEEPALAVFGPPRPPDMPPKEPEPELEPEPEEPPKPRNILKERIEMRKKKQAERLAKIASMGEEEMAEASKPEKPEPARASPPRPRKNPLLPPEKPLFGNSEDVTAKKKKKKKAEKKKKPSSLSKKKKKKKDLGPPLVSTEALHSIRDVLTLVIIIVGAIVTGVLISIFSPENAWEKQEMVKDPRASLQMYIDKIKAPRLSGAPAAAPAAAPAPAARSELEEALARLDALMEDDAAPAPPAAAAAAAAACSEGAGGACAAAAGGAPEDPEVAGEFAVVDEEWPGLPPDGAAAAGGPGSRGGEEEEDEFAAAGAAAAGEGGAPWEAALAEALRVGGELWRSLPCAHLPHAPLAALPLLARQALRLAFGALALLLRARPCAPDPAKSSMIGQIIGLYSAFKTTVRDVSVFIFIVVMVISSYSGWYQYLRA